MMLVDRSSVCIIIVNMQLDLLPMLQNSGKLLLDCTWIADVAATMGVPVFFIEHKMLGEPAPQLLRSAPSAERQEKTHFDMLLEPHIEAAVRATGKTKFIFAGAETHVCILQSALSFVRVGYDAFVCADAVSARSAIDNEIGLKRLQANNVHLTTKEMVFFEMLRHSEFPNYLDLSLRFLDGRYLRHLK